MGVRRWFFRAVEDKNVCLYDSEKSDLSDAVPIKKSKQELGKVVSIETTEGKSSKICDKYGVVHGLLVSE